MTDKPKLYRLNRDTLYHVHGDILALLPEEVLPDQHDLITLDPTEIDGVAELTQTVADLTSRVTALETSHAKEAPSDPAPERGEET